MWVKCLAAERLLRQQVAIFPDRGEIEAQGAFARVDLIPRVQDRISDQLGAGLGSRRPVAEPPAVLALHVAVDNERDRLLDDLTQRGECGARWLGRALASNDQRRDGAEQSRVSHGGHPPVRRGVSGRLSPDVIVVPDQVVCPSARKRLHVA